MTAEEGAVVALGIGLLISCAVLLKMGMDWVAKDWSLGNCKHRCMRFAQRSTLPIHLEAEFYDGCIKRCDERLT